MNNDSGGKERDKSGSESPHKLSASDSFPRRKGSESPRSPGSDDGRRSRSPSEERRAKHSESKTDSSSSSLPRPPSFRRTSSGERAAKHGEDAYKGSVSASGELDGGKLYRDYRMEGQQHQFGGAGKDESVATSYIRDHAEELTRARITGLDVQKMIGILSEDRTNTDALVWHTETGEIGGHPGALRRKANTNSHVSAGHTTKDIARKTALEFEFKALVPDLSKTDAATVEKAEIRSGIRGRIETIRSMSQPLEKFEEYKSDEIGRRTIHTQFGDIRKPDNYRKMAVYVHNERERRKWIAARHLMESDDLIGHVPDVMQKYIKDNGMDHLAAMNAFNTDVAAGRKDGINSAATSQAFEIDSKETMRAAVTRGRALSAPRRRYSK